MMHLGPRRKTNTVFVFFQVIGHHRQPSDTFSMHLSCNSGWVDVAIDRLPTGHRYRIVVKDLVGNVDVSGNTRAQGQ